MSFINNASTEEEQQLPIRWCGYGSPLEGLIGADDMRRELDDNQIAACNAAWAMDHHLNLALEAALKVDRIRTFYSDPPYCGPGTPFQAIEAAVAKAKAHALSEEAD